MTFRDMMKDQGLRYLNLMRVNLQKRIYGFIVFVMNFKTIRGTFVSFANQVEFYKYMYSDQSSFWPGKHHLFP